MATTPPVPKHELIGPASRRGLLLGLAALPLTNATAVGSPHADRPLSDLATACIAQVERSRRWDADPYSWTEEEGDAEMDRISATFERAITEPSAGLSDLAAKSCLMLDDLDRFHPEDEYGSDEFRLMRVILREAIAMGVVA